MQGRRPQNDAYSAANTLWYTLKEYSKTDTLAMHCYQKILSKKPSHHTAKRDLMHVLLVVIQNIRLQGVWPLV